MRLPLRETSQGYSTKAVIDLAAFRHNLSIVRSRLKDGAAIMAVVKANAYGHGIREIAAEAVQNGVEYLGVARAYEGIELRDAGVRSPVLVFEIAPPDFLTQAIDGTLDLTVCTLEGARQINAAALRLRRKAVVHVKVDTGMGRLGVSDHDAPAMIEAVAQLPGIELKGVYSHFATSEDPDPAYARSQLDRFHRVLECLATKNIEVPVVHMANSGAILSLPDAHFTMVRPGILLYGSAPTRVMENAAHLKPVMTLRSKVAFIKTVEANTSISYGRRFSTTKRTRIGTVPIGYGDGYMRSLTSRAEVLIHGTRYPVVGSISMDHVMVDLGEKAEVNEWDDVVLMGKDGKDAITLWDLAEKVGTLPYEITCAISPRVPRIFVR